MYPFRRCTKRLTAFTGLTLGQKEKGAGVFAGMSPPRAASKENGGRNRFHLKGRPSSASCIRPRCWFSPSLYSATSE